MGIERRKFPRLDLNVKVVLKKVDASSFNQPGIVGLARNISAGGICLVVYEKVSGGDVLDLVFELPTERIIRVRGRVVWAKALELIGKENWVKYDTGIEFMEISDDDKEEIKKYVVSFF